MKLRALVVDDSRVMRGIVMNTLRKTSLAEFEFTEAENGADAIAKFHPDRIDILFVDWNMPQMSGHEVIRALRAEPGLAPVPILILSGEPISRSDLKVLGADGAVQKPFDIPALIAQIHAHLGADRGSR